MIAHAVRPAHARPSGTIGRVIKELVIVVVGALIMTVLIRTFVGETFGVPSGSMEPTLEVGDRIAVQKLTGFERGDVVVFKDPNRWLGDPPTPARGPIDRALEFIGVLPDTGTDYLVKRAIGLPGDRVVCCDAQGRITVNGQPLDEDGYLYRSPGSPSRPSDGAFAVTVPKDRIWVMGDHRDDSADSRCHLDEESPDGPFMSAFVPVDDVVGPVFAVIAPLSRSAPLVRPPTFDPIPDAKDPPQSRPVVEVPSSPC